MSAAPRATRSLSRKRDVASVCLRHAGVTPKTNAELKSHARSVRLSGTVAALSNEALGPASLYAFLTGRRYLGLFDATSNTLPPDCLIGLHSNVSLELLDALFNRNAAQNAAGLIVAPSKAALRDVVLMRALAVRGPGASHRRITIYPHHLLGQPNCAEAEVLDAHADAAAFRDALIGDAALVVLRTHSDGVDAYLHAGLTLCAIDAPNFDSAARAPLCALTGNCHRHGTSISSAHDGKRLLRAQECAARVLVLDSCFGYLARTAAIDARWGLLDGFMRAPGIGAVITSWDICIGSATDHAALVADINSGMALGSAVARFNASDVARMSGTRVALFGDPALTIFPRATAHMPTQAAQREAHEAYDNAGIRLWQLLLGMLYHRKPESMSIPILTAQACLNSLDLAAALGHPVEGTGGAGEGVVFRQSIVALLRDMGTGLSTYWLEMAKSATEPASAPCPQCGGPAMLHRLQLTCAPASDRLWQSCGACGVVVDQPSDWSADHRIDGRGQLALDWTTIPSDAEVTVLVSAKDKRPALLVDHDQLFGKASFWVSDLPNLPPGPVKITLLIQRQASYGLYSRELHQTAITW